MKSLIVKRYGLLLLGVLIIGFSGCTATREQEVEGDLNEFRSWVNTQTSQLADRTEEDWQKTKQDFRKRTEELDQKQEKFSDKLKADYQELKDEFNEKDRERAQMVERKTRVKQWQQDLLGQYAETSSINAGNVRQAYITFLENVRAKRSTWDNEDWEMAKLVMQELNTRKEAVDDDLPADDEVKIKALQMEFTALETGDDLGGD